MGCVGDGGGSVGELIIGCSAGGAHLVADLARGPRAVEAWVADHPEYAIDRCVRKVEYITDRVTGGTPAVAGVLTS